MADRLSSPQLASFLSDVDMILAKAVAGLPKHSDFVSAHCAAAP
jgi:hypothetical protein